MSIVLKYIGNGDNIPHIPARDLDKNDISEITISGYETDGEVIELLVLRGLYSKAKPKLSKKKVTVIPETEIADKE